jgi:hypothetical protein
MSLEWFLSAVVSVTGSTLFGHFEEKTPRWRRLSKWAAYFGATALLRRKQGRPWTFMWVLGWPALGLSFHLWWCHRHSIDPLTAEPRDRYYELRGWTR